MFEQLIMALYDFNVTSRLSVALFDMNNKCVMEWGVDTSLPPCIEQLQALLHKAGAIEKYRSAPYLEGECVVCSLDSLAYESCTVAFWPLPLPPSEREMIRSLYVSLLHQMIHAHVCISPKLLAKSSYYDRRVRQVIAVLESDLEENPTLPELAQAVGMSETSLCRLFKKDTGYAITAYHNRLRIEHSLMLLTQSNDSITEISHRSGFSDSAYFSRVFKQVMGQGPQTYRKTMGHACKTFTQN